MKKILSALTFFLIFQIGTVSIRAEFKKPADTELKKILAEFDRYAVKSMADWKIPGMAVGIVLEGETIFAKGYGVKALGGSLPVSEKTIFQIGSTTKAFTATLAGMLVDEGKFKWSDPVVQHLPVFMMYDPWVTRAFQIDDLMAQHSGMPGNAADTLFFLGFDRPYIIQTLRNIKPISSFRARYAYQNNLWLVAGQLIEKAAGKPYEQVLKERIFDPLGMSHSSTDKVSFLAAKDVSALHAAEGDQVRLVPRDWEFLDWSYVAGPAGAINSNIPDMLKWLAFQMDDGKVKDKTLVTEASLRVIRSPKTVMSPDSPPQKNAFYCLGWLYQERSPYPVIWHNGGTLMKTMVAYIPEEKLGIVVLSNYVTPLPEILAFRFFDQYEGKPDKDYSAESLSEMEKSRKVKKPAAPQNPVSPLPLDRYTGDYFNAVYGKATLSVIDGRLFLVMGPKSVKMTLTHWDRDRFALHWPVFGFDQEFGFVNFEVDPQGRIKGMVLDRLNQEADLGVFKKAEVKVKLEDSKK
jgi:CubicO group peptidase (beta-lactamase class C family)